MAKLGSPVLAQSPFSPPRLTSSFPFTRSRIWASVGGVFAGGARLGLASTARRGVGMATGSRASSSTGSRGASGQSRTPKNPDKKFYTCTKRGLGNSNCDFGTLMAGLQALQNSVQLLSNVVQAVSVDVRSLGGQQSFNKWLHVASLFVGVVLCIFMYYKA